MRLAEEPQSQARYLRWIQLGLLISLLSKPMVLPMLPVLFFLPETRRKLLLPLGIYAAISLLFLLVGRLNPGGYNGGHWGNMLRLSSGPYQFPNDVVPMISELQRDLGRYSLPLFVDRLLGRQVSPLFYKIPLLAVVVMSFSPLILQQREQRLRAALVTISLCVLAHFFSYYEAQEYHYATLLPVMLVLLWLWQRESVPGLRRLLLACFLVSLPIFLPTPYFFTQDSSRFQTISFLQRVGTVVIAFAGLAVYGIRSTWSRRRSTLMTPGMARQIWPVLRLGGVLGALLGSVVAAACLTIPAYLWVPPTKWTSRDFHEHYDESIAQIQRALKADSTHAGTHSILGLALVGQGRLAEAIPQFRRALEIEPDNAEAHSGLGKVLASQGRPTEAIAQFQQALKTLPSDVTIHCDLGNALIGAGRPVEAIDEFQWALRNGPDHATTRNNLGIALTNSGRPAEALAQFEQALALAPDDVDIRINFGKILEGSRRPAEAMAQFQRALEIKPDCAAAHVGLGNALLARNQFAEAVPHFRTALQLQPDSAEFLKNWAWLLATCPAEAWRNGPEAIEHAKRANHLCGGERPDILDVLAAAYAEAGWFPEAVATARKALQLAVQQKASVLADALRARLALYEAGRPYHQNAAASGDVPSRH
jgi:tetratricopeptide (TPR) repeat protein